MWDRHKLMRCEDKKREKISSLCLRAQMLFVFPAGVIMHWLNLCKCLEAGLKQIFMRLFSFWDGLPER